MLHIIEKSVLKNLPPFQWFLRKRKFRKRFETELALIKGVHENNTKHPSIIYFSFNKAATQYVKSILRCCAIENDMVPVKINEYAFQTNFPFLGKLSIQEMEKYKHIFRKTGYLYGPFGNMIEGIQSLKDYKTILITRDPRDILVSEYYSYAYSHATPKDKTNKYEKFMSMRNKALSSEIDDYAISESDRVYDSFNRYHNLLRNRYTHTYLTTYEQMVFDFETWLTDIINYCELNVSRKTIHSLINNNKNKKPKEENKYKHLRKGQPGDYRQKLKPKTIEYLNDKFVSILTRYHYNQT